jgi:hypothetical protein
LFFPILLALVACDFTLPSKEAAPSDDQIKPGAALPARERQLILPAKAPGPPPPEAGISPSQCNTMTDGGPVKGPDCVTQEIHCGETVIGHTRGGVNRFNSQWWRQYFCWPDTVNHNGGDERVYKLHVPLEGRIMTTITLDTPCANLDMMVFPWSGSTCPGLDANIPDCESMRKAGTERERVDEVDDGPITYLVVVEGTDEEEGAFSLTVQCQN